MDDIVSNNVLKRREIRLLLEKLPEVDDRITITQNLDMGERNSIVKRYYVYQFCVLTDPFELKDVIEQYNIVKDPKRIQVKFSKAGLFEFCKHKIFKEMATDFKARLAFRFENKQAMIRFSFQEDSDANYLSSFLDKLKILLEWYIGKAKDNEEVMRVYQKKVSEACENHIKGLKEHNKLRLSRPDKPHKQQIKPVKPKDTSDVVKTSVQSIEDLF